MRENSELQIMYLMDDQSRRGTRSNVIHIDYNGFRLSYTSKYMDLCK